VHSLHYHACYRSAQYSLLPPTTLYSTATYTCVCVAQQLAACGNMDAIAVLSQPYTTSEQQPHTNPEWQSSGAGVPLTASIEQVCQDLNSCTIVCSDTVSVVGADFVEV
jgi:hypothetical protein